MPLFDDFERTDASPAYHLEDHFTFLNRAATAYWARVRELLAAWVNRLPEGEREDVIARMRSRDNRQFLGAFWETYLFVSFEHFGFAVEMHPEVPTSNHRPDFRIAFGSDLAYVEATVATDSDDRLARDRRRGQIYDTLNARVQSPSFWLSVDLVEEDVGAPSVRRHIRSLQAWLDGLDADQIQELLDSRLYEALPTFDIEDRGWVIRVKALPKSPQSRGASDGRAIGIYPGEAGSFDIRGRIPAALEEKADRYGELGAPYVIAVMEDTRIPEGDAIFYSLFGSPVIRVQIGDTGDAESTLANDGFWRGPNGPVNTHVSAVVAAQNLYDYKVAKQAPDVWHNPWADRPLATVLPWRSHRIDSQGGLQTIEPSVAPHEIFGITEQWPGPEGPFDIWPSVE